MADTNQSTETILDDPQAVPPEQHDEAPEQPAQEEGSPSDTEASEAFHAEAEDHVDTYVAPREYEGIDTRTPEGNLASRSNIVTDGPGTTGYVGSSPIAELLPGGEIGTPEQPRPLAQTPGEDVT